MIHEEPSIRVGILDGVPEIHGEFLEPYNVSGVLSMEGEFVVRPNGAGVILSGASGKTLGPVSQITCAGSKGSRFVIRSVTIGIHFHWERKEDEVFEGDVTFCARPDGGLVAINAIGLEDYLRSVIASEMSAEASLEFLKAHAITSRSWLAAMLERTGTAPQPPPGGPNEGGEIVRWYTREDHDLYDVCADDHCQRYQGTSKIISPAANEAVTGTEGLFLTRAGEVCDARFHKACGGRTEVFSSAWEDRDVPYLTSISDARATHATPSSEADASNWILSHPEAYCNCRDGELLKQVLPSFDQETTDFFRWQVRYRSTELEEILQERSGYDFGTLHELIPLQRGRSARITRLKIVGSKATLIVGKELEIRKWLSRSHLYSSAFVVRHQRDSSGHLTEIDLHGAGWGHGVGLCQIGAAVMGAKGFSGEEIVLHYFPGATLERLY